MQKVENGVVSGCYVSLKVIRNSTS